MDPDPADLLYAFALADAADRVSTSHFCSEALRTTTKDDGTPVSQVDLAVEETMLALVRRDRPADGVLGEEVGAHPGSPARRWIFDGIDGTHNYAAGRAGWGTIIALEVDGDVALGLVSSPVLGRRWWAERGGGAWSAPNAADGSFDSGAATRLGCTAQAALAAASVIVTPFEGFLLGWRNEVPKRFTPPASPRSQCFAIDAAMVASGEVDVAIITLGGVWDFAATSLVVCEAGGAFHDAWGGHRLDTATGVFTNAMLVEPVLAVLAGLRPGEPDRPQLAKTVSTPIGGRGATSELDTGEDRWRRFGIASMPSMSARVHVENAAPMVLDIVDERAAHLAHPFVGVTTDGVLRAGLRTLGGPALSTRAIADGASTFLRALSPEQRARATFEMGAIEWRTWINVRMNHFRHGVMLEDLTPPVRDLALAVLRATLSARGFHQARSIMRMNELLAELTGDREAFGEWPYFVSIFGSPEGGEPWGWQIDGHHLCINAVVFDGRVVGERWRTLLGSLCSAPRTGQRARREAVDSSPDPDVLARLRGRSLLTTHDWSGDELSALLALAARFQQLDRGGISTAFLPYELAYAVFFDNSTRTKSAWAGAAARLGMQPVIVDGSSTQVSHGETAEETGAMLGMNAHALGIRHDLILGEGNTFMRDVKRGIDDYLAASDDARVVPVVNLQCDIDHPTQTLADLLWLCEHFGGDVAGKRITVSWAYSPSYAKPLSVPQGLVSLLTRFGAHVTLAHPEGYELSPEPMAWAADGAARSGGSFQVTHDMDAAFVEADAVYPKSWGPRSSMLERVAANRAGDMAAMHDIERRALAANAAHRAWICDERRMSLTADALYLHCLPADIGSEVTAGVMRRFRVAVAEEANKKVYVIMALLAAAKVDDLAARVSPTTTPAPGLEV